VSGDDSKEITFLKAIMEELRVHPFYGYRKVAEALKDMGVTRKQVRRIMSKAGLCAIYPKRRLSRACKEHKKYPYLLKGMNIWLPNQVWATDITYIKLFGGNVYLVAIMDLYSRKVLSWSLSNTLDAEFCISALNDAIESYGIPAIFNTDQGCQFTSDAFIGVLKRHGIRISMDSKGRALDNIYVERLWRSLKYEDIYLNDYRSMEDLKAGLKKYFNFYNTERFHQSLDYSHRMKYIIQLSVMSVRKK
jgi:putative transposase